MLQKEIVYYFSLIKMMFVVMLEERVSYEIDIKIVVCKYISVSPGRPSAMLG